MSFVIFYQICLYGFAAALASSISLSSVFGALLLSGWLTHFGMHRLGKASAPPTAKSGLEWFFILYLLVVGTSFLMGESYSGERLRQTLKMHWLLTFYALFFSMLALSKRQLMGVVMVYLGSATLSSLVGVWQFLTWPDPGEIRTGGLLNDTIGFGHCSALWLTLSVGLLIHRFAEKEWSIAYYMLLVASFVIFCGLLTSGTRGGILPVIGVFPLFVLFWYRELWQGLKKHLTTQRVMAFLLLVGLFVHPLYQALLGAVLRTRVLVDGDLSALPRTSVWSIHWAIFKDHPIWGVGMNYGYSLAESYEARLGISVLRDAWTPHAHSNYLQVLSGLGVMGALAYMLMFAKFFAINLKGYWCAPRASLTRHLLLALLVAQVIFHLTGVVDTNFRHTGDKNNLLFLLTLMLCLASRQQRSDA